MQHNKYEHIKQAVLLQQKNILMKAVTELFPYANQAQSYLFRRLIAMAVQL